MPASRSSTRTPASSPRRATATRCSRPAAGLLGRHVGQPAAGLQLGQPHRHRAAEPALSRLAEHQPHAGRGHQLDEGRGPPHVQGRVLQQPQLQGAEHRRARSRARWTSTTTPTISWTRSSAMPMPRSASSPLPAGGEVRRRQHDLQQHGVLHPGQLEGEQPVDPRLRHPLHAPAAAVRPVPADVELLPGTVVAGAAPVLYIAGCSNGATVCSGNTRNAMDPRNGQIVLPPGAANTQVLIGTPIPNVGNPLNGIRQAGDGISEYGYTWPAIVFGPRFGAAYDISGDQRLDRPRRRRPLLRSSGRQHRLLDPEQPADHERGGPAQRHARRRSAGGLAPARSPAWRPSSTTPRSRPRGSGRSASQMALPWASSLDVSYVGNRGVNRLGAFQRRRRGQPERG